VITRHASIIAKGYWPP